MAESFNIYLDESCHLEHDGIPVMAIGIVWCIADKSREVSVRMRDIKRKHGLSDKFEIKWTKVSPAKIDFYLSILDYFLDDDDLHFHAVITLDKSKLRNTGDIQSHDDWYYRMCFSLLEPLIDPTQHYAVYMDIKDTRSEEKRKLLEQYLRTAHFDGDGDIVRRVQQIRSHESALLQLSDFILGMVTYANRGLSGSEAKKTLVLRIQERTGFSLLRPTWLREPKVNLRIWQGGE